MITVITGEIAVGSVVFWHQRSRKGASIIYTKCKGAVLAIDGQIATIKRHGNNRRVDVHLSRLTLEGNDTPTSLVEQAKREFQL